MLNDGFVGARGCFPSLGLSVASGGVLFADPGQVDTYITFFGKKNLSKSLLYFITPLDSQFVVQYQQLYPGPGAISYLATGLVVSRCDQAISAPGVTASDSAAVGVAVWLVLIPALAWVGVRRVLKD